MHHNKGIAKMIHRPGLYLLSYLKNIFLILSMSVHRSRHRVNNFIKPK